MDIFPTIAVALHALGATIWVGGMFFAYQVLRPALGGFEGPQRLKTWAAVFPRFFSWVWAAVIALWATGYMQVFWDFGGFDVAGWHVQIMHITGIVMFFIYFFLFFGPYPRFQAAVRAEDWPAAAARLATIRRIVGLNLILGLVTVAIGASGRFWG